MREVAIKLLRIYHRDRWRISPRKLGASVDDVVLDARKPPSPEDAAIIAEQCSPIAARFGYHAEGHTARTSPIEMLSGASRLS